ncbi:electron transfer flavoprotein-ubiquinone oxidoreductase [Mycena vulgaris]|nr:electron transfer flavoprotein-ubiquinone oxidoreductase [Mycena vulgaris]
MLPFSLNHVETRVALVQRRKTHRSLASGLRSFYTKFARPGLRAGAALRPAPNTKRLAYGARKEVRVVFLEKGGQVSAHMLSGAVIEPSALDALLPDWRETMNNDGNYIASLSRVAAWFSGIAEELGAEVYVGFAGARLLFSKSSEATDAQGPAVRSVRSVLTHDAGLTRQRTKSVHFEPGVGFYARATLLVEGAHGSLSNSTIAIYDLRAHSEAQTYRLGLKEVWRVPKEKHVPGWPLGWGTYCGEWKADGLNPWLEAYREFQHIKHHPHFRVLLAAPDAERPAYGARTLSEDGLQNLPQLRFPGGALIVCSAGVVNTAKIKGTHNAMRTGMLAAEAAFAGLHPRSSPPAHPLLPLPPPSLPPPPPPTPTSTSASIL